MQKGKLPGKDWRDATSSGSGSELCRLGEAQLLCVFVGWQMKLWGMSHCGVKCAWGCLYRSLDNLSFIIYCFHLLWTLITELLEHVIVTIGFLQLGKLLLWCSGVHWSSAVWEMCVQRTKLWNGWINVGALREEWVDSLHPAWQSCRSAGRCQWHHGGDIMGLTQHLQQWLSCTSVSGPPRAGGLQCEQVWGTAVRRSELLVPHVELAAWSHQWQLLRAISRMWGVSRGDRAVTSLSQSLGTATLCRLWALCWFQSSGRG